MDMRCCNGFIKGGILSSAPTADTTGYDTPYLGWTADRKAFLHIGSGTWIDLTAKAESGDAGKKAKNVGK